MSKTYTITDWTHEIAGIYIKEGDLCIDATAGKGKDTLFLCEKVGKTGHVLAFDIQPEATAMTEALLEKYNMKERAEVFCQGHEHMGEYAEPGTVSVILFNLGYLPGGDHQKATRAETTLQAANQGLSLLKSGGLMLLCIYSGGDSGFSEKEAVLSWARTLPAGEYDVIETPFINKPNNPPLPLVIRKR
jgi:hypothetical protein